MSSIFGVIPPLKPVAVNPCTPTLSIASASAASLASIESTLAASVGSAENTVLNALHVPGLASLLSSISSVSASLSLAGLSSSAGFSPFASIVQAIVGKAIQGAISGVESAVLSQATSLANTVIEQATSAVAKLTAAQLEKDLSPLVNAIASINAIVSKVEADKILVSSILSTAKICPAKAAIMTEVFFKQGAR